METEFDPLTTAHIDLQIEEEFPKIQLEAEKFELWFQPVYDLTTGVILHNEVLGALARWARKLTTASIIIHCSSKYSVTQSVGSHHC